MKRFGKMALKGKGECHHPNIWPAKDLEDDKSNKDDACGEERRNSQRLKF